MSQTVQLQDVLNQVNDMNQNYSVSTIDAGNKMRAINRAIEYVQRRLGLPSDRKIQSFYFYEDTKFYDLNTDYSDLIQLYYNTTNSNITGDNNNAKNQWVPEEDVGILRFTGQYDWHNKYAYTSMNGKSQILAAGHNLKPSIPICSFDTTTGLTFSSSITGAAVDSNIYKQNGASVVFNVNSSESTSTIKINSVLLDIRNLLNSQGAFRLFTYLPTGTTGYFSSINIQLVSSTGNYYQISTTTDYLGNAWTANGWSLLSFKTSDATTVGSPDASSIAYINIDFVHSGTFSDISNMRVDYMYTVNPDLLDLVYYSAYKGTDVTGVTQKIILDNVTDILAFGAIAPDLIYPIALKAATILWPQLRADPNFMQSYEAEFNKTMLLYGKQYPRKRNPISAKTVLLR